MKKVLVVATFAAFGLISCKKDYTCTCTTTSGGQSGTSSSTTINDTKKNAEELCDEDDATVTWGGSTAITDCEIQ
ncbi:MAG: hypothetical protein ACI865_001839 [Flavobacteriaceae bacterium]|jgi:hypothetical protein